VNLFDIIVVVILGYCVIRGIFRGLIKELFSLIGVFGGFYAAYTYYMVLAKPLSRWIANTGYLNILSFMTIFCFVFIIISILGIIIHYILNIAFLGWVDRICGAGFSTVKGIMIASVLLITLTTFLPKGAPVIKDSLLSPHVALVAEKMVKVVPKNMKHAFITKITESKKVWKKKK
jgi:membrane protein required for colicin V production